MKNQGGCREKPHPVNLPPTVKQGVEGHQERRQEVATDRQEGHPGGERREKGSRRDSSEGLEQSDGSTSGNTQDNIFELFDVEAEAEALLLWPPDTKSQVIGKDSDAGKG